MVKSVKIMSIDKLLKRYFIIEVHDLWLKDSPELYLEMLLRKKRSSRKWFLIDFVFALVLYYITTRRLGVCVFYERSNRYTNSRPRLTFLHSFTVSKYTITKNFCGKIQIFSIFQKCTVFKITKNTSFEFLHQKLAKVIHWF